MSLRQIIFAILLLTGQAVSAQEIADASPCAALEKPMMTRTQILEMLSCVNGELARSFSRGLPARVDDNTTLIGVISAGPSLVYSMQLRGRREDYSAADIARRERRVRDNVCATPSMREMIGYGGGYQYLWLDQEGRRIHGFVIHHCT